MRGWGAVREQEQDATVEADDGHRRGHSLPDAIGGLLRAGAGLAGHLVPHPGPLRWRHGHGFYDAPAALDGLQPGDLVRTEPMTAYLAPGLRLRARAWRVLYRSTAASGAPTAVSGVVLVPRAAGRGPQPVVGYAPGTHGLANHSAPSRLLARGLEWEAALLAMLLSRGFAVAMTDYEGLGTPGDHPYVIGRALGPNVLDALRAARRLEDAALPADGPLGVIGYSEGGLAAGWAAELHDEYAPELDIAGIACGSVPGDLEHLGDHMEGSLFSFFAGYGAVGLNAAYPELGLERYLTAEGEEHIHRLRRSSILSAALRGPHFTGVDDLMVENVLRRPDWRARMQENSLGRTAPRAPVYLHTSKLDPIVPPGVTRELAARWRALGGQVVLRETPALEHGSGALLGTPAAARWLTRRLRAAAAAQAAARPGAVSQGRGAGRRLRAA